MRKQKFLAILLTMVVVTGTVLSGCSQKQETSGDAKDEQTSAPSTTSPGAEDVSANEERMPKFEEIQFPDNMPASPTMAEKDWYGYDNMDEKYEIEILTHNYGQPPLAPEEDPINIWLSQKFNMDIKFTAINNADLETTLSTRFASNDEPDVCVLPTRELGFVLSDQDLLIDAKEVYPYMPQTTKFVTKNMIEWSTNKNNEEIPFITKYGIQDGVWGFAVRQDWLDKFGMQPPTTKDELLAYAKACTFEDPDGNGKDDTYFMTGAGAGKGWGMLGGFNTMFGNPSAVVENGQLAHPLFNGIQKEYLMFLKELYDMKVLAPDWYTIEWEKSKSYTLNDKVGMVWYPAGVLYQEYTSAKSKDPESLNVWKFWAEPPIEGGKYGASGNPGYMVGFSESKFEDRNKLKRVAHMLDTCVIGGENFFHTIQGSTTEVYENVGIKTEDVRKGVYQEDGTFYLENDPAAFPWNIGSKYDAIQPWQVFGLSVSWQMSAPSDDPFNGPYAEKSNEYIKVVNNYDRWTNDALRVTLTGKAMEASAGMVDWTAAQELAFVTGKRSFDEWDKYCEEWLNKGGKDIIAQTAECLEVPVPDYAK